MKPLMAQVHLPKNIVSEMKIGNTRIVFSDDFVQPPEEQERIKKRLGHLWYQAELQKQTQKNSD